MANLKEGELLTSEEEAKCGVSHGGWKPNMPQRVNTEARHLLPVSPGQAVKTRHYDIYRCQGRDPQSRVIQECS